MTYKFSSPKSSAPLVICLTSVPWEELLKGQHVGGSFLAPPHVPNGGTSEGVTPLAAYSPFPSSPQKPLVHVYLLTRALPATGCVPSLSAHTTGSKSGAILYHPHPQGTSAVSGDIFACLGGRQVLLASSG